MWLQMCVRLPLYQTDVCVRLPLYQTDACASTAVPDRFLCKLCPSTIQLDVNPVSYFILPDSGTYKRHDSATLAPDTVQLYKSCKNRRIFTE